MLNSIFDQMDFGPLQEFLDEDDVTDISYSNGGQVWLKTLSKGIYQVNRPDINNVFMEKLAFQCSNVMGKTFNMAHPFLDAESAELRMNFVHDSIATNGVACLIRKTPAKIRLNKEKLIDEQYVTAQIHDFLLRCIEGHCNIIVAGETGSGKTELVKYLASKTKEDEKIITIEDTLELHLDKIFPTRDIVAMKTNNIASYTEALVACMRQNPIWILLAEVRSGEGVLAVRNSISSGHHILSTIHADRASSIPMRMYSLLESSQDIEQFLGSIHRYVQIGIYVKGYFSKRLGRFQREIIEVCEFYIDEDNNARSNMLYQKSLDGRVTLHNPTHNLIDYLAIGNVSLPEDTFGLGPSNEGFDDTNRTEMPEAEEVKPVNVEDPFAMNKENDNEDNGAEGNDGGNQIVPNTMPNNQQNNVQPVPQQQENKSIPQESLKPVENLQTPVQPLNSTQPIQPQPTGQVPLQPQPQSNIMQPPVGTVINANIPQQPLGQPQVMPSSNQQIINNPQVMPNNIPSPGPSVNMLGTNVSGIMQNQAN